MTVEELKNKVEFETSQIWREIFENHISEEKLYRLILNTPRISTATLLINHTCNLTCKHCFYGNDMLYEPELTLDEWEKVIDRLFDIGVQHFHIAGREPFINNKIAGILEYLKKIKLAQGIRYGVITNGTLVGKYIYQLSGLNIDYIDFSIDGTKRENDWLRGEGSFGKTVENLKLILNRRITNIYVNSVAHQKNYYNLPIMIKELSQVGVEYFYIQPMLPIGRAQKLRNILITPSQYNNLIDTCYSLLMSSNNQLTIKLLIYPTMFPFLYKENEKVKQIVHNYMRTGSFYLKERNSTLSFEFHPFCMSHWRECQITADGYYIGCFMMLTAKDYRKYSIGNVRKENIRKIWTKSLQRDSLLHKIIKSYNTKKCKNCDYFWFCHGGCRMASYITHGVWDKKDITCYISQK